MGLTFVSGRANAGKTGIVVRRAIEAAERGRMAHVVVPSQPDARRLEDEIAGKAPLGVRVLTFHGFVNELWALHGDGRRPVSGSTRLAFLQRVIGDRNDAEIAAVPSTPGLLRFLERGVRDSGPEALPEGRPGSPSMVTVVDLATQYRRLLAHAGLVEPSWIPALLCEHDIVLEGPVGLARFDTLLPRQVRLLMHLSRFSDVTVTLNWQDSFVPTQVNDGIAAQLIEAAQEVVRIEEAEPSNELGFLAGGLFGPPMALQSEGMVVRAIAAGEDGEHALVARIVRDELDRGVAPNRVAVVCRDTGRRLAALIRALEAVDARITVEVTREVNATRLGRAFAALLALTVGVGGRAQAEALLMSPYCALGRGAADELSRSWRRRRVLDSRELSRGIVSTGGSLGNAMSRACDLADSAIDRETSGKWKTLLDTLLSTQCEWKMDAPVNEAMADDARAHKAIVHAIVEMASVDGHPFGARDLAAALPSMRLAPVQNEVAGAVQVIDADLLGSRRFDVVILMALTASGFPIAERDSLEGEFLTLLDGETASGVEQGRARFYSLVTRARERLYLVRQECDAEGELLAASPALEELRDLYRTPGSGVDDAPVAPPQVLEAPLADIAALAPVFGRGRRDERSASSPLAMRVLERGELTAEVALTSARDRTVFSASEVEAYLQCPYRWFYQHVLRPREIDFEFDARELGTRAHALLAGFYERLPVELGLGRVTTSVLDACLDLFDRVSERLGATMAVPESVDEEIGAARALGWARRIVVDDATMFDSTELTEPEVTFETVAFAKHLFKGRIDRIDTGPEFVFVTDYKASSAVRGFAKFESAGIVQAVLYAVAAEQRAARPVAGSVYRSLSSRVCRGFWRADLLESPPQRFTSADALDEQAFRGLVEQTEERVAAAIEGMKAGRIDRTPNAGACSYCALVDACQGGRR